MRAIILSALLLATMQATVFAQWGHGERGSGTLKTETRTFQGVNGVALETMGSLTIQIGGSEALDIETDDNLLQDVTTELRDGVLHISTRRNINPSKGLRMRLTVKGLEKISTSSSGDIAAPALDAAKMDIRSSSSGDIKCGPIKAKHVRVSLSSSGDVAIFAIKAMTLEASLSSSGDLSIGKGVVDEQEVNISSSGDYKAPDLQSRKAVVSSSSSGDARIQVSEELDASSSSSGDIRYSGNPARVSAHESSSGDITAE